MSISYSAEQYDQEFKSNRLGMYEVPKPVLAKEPKTNTGATSFIADQKGHLLDGAKKGDSNPFGDYVGTWDLPKVIPGPYQLNPTSRSNKNFDNLQEKRDNTDRLIKQAAEAQKPVKLRKNVPEHSQEAPFRVNEALHYRVDAPNDLDDDNVYYNPNDDQLDN